MVSELASESVKLIVSKPAGSKKWQGFASLFVWVFSVGNFGSSLWVCQSDRVYPFKEHKATCTSVTNMTPMYYVPT